MRVILLSVFLLSACANTPTYTESDRTQNSPPMWLNANYDQAYTSNENFWPLKYSSDEISRYTQEAIDNNYAIGQSRLNVEIQAKQLSIAQANFLPELSLDYGATRQKRSTGTTATQTLSLSGRYELDLWGKLSAFEKSQLYDYLSAKATFESQIQTLVSNVFIAYVTAIESQQLHALFISKSENSRKGLQIIEDGYKQGLNSALDVYLARNELNSDLSRQTQQKAIKIASIRSLETLLGIYPTGNLVVSDPIPTIENISIGIPADMLMNKPSLRASWLDLLSSDANLAYVHKQRFPSFQLTANIGSSEEKLKDLFSSDLIWSLVGSIASPIYNAGTLKANEDIARLNMQSTELAYLDEVNNAFADVENALSNEDSLMQRQGLLVNAQENALAAQDLAFEQYLKGLVSYTTVLEAQTRAVDAQSSLIQVNRELFTNRISLHLALGSNFSSDSDKSDLINDSN